MVRPAARTAVRSGVRSACKGVGTHTTTAVAEASTSGSELARNPSASMSPTSESLRSST